MEAKMESEKDTVGRIMERSPVEPQAERYRPHMRRIKEAQVSGFGDLHENAKSIGKLLLDEDGISRHSERGKLYMVVPNVFL